MSDDLAIDRPEAAAVADLRQNHESCKKLREGIARERPFGGLTEQLDQEQAQDKANRRAEYLLDRIHADLMTDPGALADIDVERAGNHIADAGEKNGGLGTGRDHKQQDADYGDALQGD